MRRLAQLFEELEARPADGDRVASLSRYLAAVDADTALQARRWLLAGAAPAGRVRRPSADALGAALRDHLRSTGEPDWVIEAGLAACEDLADAWALLLPDPPADDAADPALAHWLPRWAEACARGGAAAVVALIAGLPDAPTRRWALRASLGRVRAVLSPWQWARAKARAGGHDASAWAWQSFRGGSGEHDGGWPQPRPAPHWPQPRPAPHWQEPAAADVDAIARLRAQQHAGELVAEARWPGRRVQVIVRGTDVAVWGTDGELLNAQLPPALLAAAAAGGDAALDAVLFAWRHGRAIAPPGPERRPAPPPPSLHLAVLDGGCAGAPDETSRDRREALQRRFPSWPAEPEPGPPPTVFVNAGLAAERADPARLDALAALGARGLVLRRPAARRGEPAGWILRPSPARVRAVLQVVPSRLLARSAAADPRALAAASFGFSLWDRPPVSLDECHRAAAAAAGQIAVPVGVPRLLPFARLPLGGLEADALRRLHDRLRALPAQRFGSVSIVGPALVFELSFASLRTSRRHKIGVVAEGARVLAWCEAAGLDALQSARDLPEAGP